MTVGDGGLIVVVGVPFVGELVTVVVEGVKVIVV